MKRVTANLLTDSSPRRSLFAVWRWPKRVWCVIGVLAAVSLAINLNAGYRFWQLQRRIAARRTAIGPAGGLSKNEPVPIADWEEKLKKTHKSRRAAELSGE